MHSLVINNIDSVASLCMLKAEVVCLLYILTVFLNLIWPRNPFALYNFLRNTQYNSYV
jgi:hypothetical protein